MQVSTASTLTDHEMHRQGLYYPKAHVYCKSQFYTLSTVATYQIDHTCNGKLQQGNNLYTHVASA